MGVWECEGVEMWSMGVWGYESVRVEGVKAELHPHVPTPSHSHTPILPYSTSPYCLHGKTYFLGIFAKSQLRNASSLRV
jgi:hypothetical protein